MLIARINLGLTLIERDRLVEAAEVLGRCMEAARRGRRPIVEVVLQIFLLPSLAHAGDWDTWDAWLPAAHGFLVERRAFEVDCARIAERAAREAEARGQNARARSAWAFAAAQYEGLGRTDDAARCAGRAADGLGGRSA